MTITLEELARQLPQLRKLAKELWGESEHRCIDCGLDVGEPHDHIRISKDWARHFQSMVMSPDPISYLTEHMPK